MNQNINNQAHITQRINILQNKLNTYPKSYITPIMLHMFQELKTNKFLIDLCLQIWNLTPSQLLTLDELIDASILVQLSYNVQILYLSLPSMCDYDRGNISKLALSDIQLGIIWITAFIWRESTNMVSRWQKKSVTVENKKFLQKLAVYYQTKLVNQHKSIHFSQLSKSILERRKQILDHLNKTDNQFYNEILQFFNSVCITKHTKLMSYQQIILDTQLTPYYVLLYPQMENGKKPKHKDKHKLQTNILMKQLLYQKYEEIYTSYQNRRNIGIPFL